MPGSASRPPTALIVIDIEADQRVIAGLREDQAIEIGAVRWCEPTGVTSEHRGLVRPTWGTLSPFIVELCGYTAEDVEAIESAGDFPSALSELLAWIDSCGGGSFASWGDYDRKQLLRDCARHGLQPPDWLGRHLNLKALHARVHGCKPCGMAAALRRAGLPLVGRHHLGIDDARNVARLADLLARRGADMAPTASPEASPGLRS